ncbi:hypothetical protein PSPO01_16259 [Paraphaeosphaeria sporulosa]
MLTSRPFDIDGRELPTASYQMMVCLNVDTDLTSTAAKSHITHKAAELGPRFRYGLALCQKLGAELNEVRDMKHDKFKYFYGLKENAKGGKTLFKMEEIDDDWV